MALPAPALPAPALPVPVLPAPEPAPVPAAPKAVKFGRTLKKVPSLNFEQTLKLIARTPNTARAAQRVYPRRWL